MLDQRIRLTRVGVLLAAALLAPIVFAHRGARRHRVADRPPTAVIVVGTPRPTRGAARIDGVVPGTLDLNVKPGATEVWIDGRLRGPCDAFDGFPGKLHLRPGIRRVRLVTPDGLTVTRELRVRAGIELNVKLDLR